jgi:hypothetical protein
MQSPRFGIVNGQKRENALDLAPTTTVDLDSELLHQPDEKVAR